MGDMTDDFRAMGAWGKQEKSERLKRASEILRGEFVKLNEYHWRKVFGLWTLEPSRFAEPDLMLEKIREYRRKHRGTT